MKPCPIALAATGSDCYSDFVLSEQNDTKHMKIISQLTIVAALAASLQAATAGDITGSITLKGTPPPEKEITPLKEDATCGKLHASSPMTRFYVVGGKGELADVVVYLKGVTGKSTGAAAAPAVIDQKGCEYSPQIIAVQTGQKIAVKNSDPVLHNVHTQPSPDGANAKSEFNKAQMAGGADLEFTFSAAENFLKFKCDVHPWMFAWVTVVDSPYYAVSAKDGTFKITNVPPGKYTLEAAHRKLGVQTKEIEVTGDGAKADFTLEVK
jgi:plastocyanin